jgi:hypothetical protein
VRTAQDKHPRQPLATDLSRAFADNGFIYLDYYNEMRQRLARRTEEESTDYWVIKEKDGHPNIAGHEFIAGIFLRGLRRAGILQQQWMEERSTSTTDEESP